MKLSLCMIAKNASADIRRSLQSLQGQVDEAIVVDTGSTDDTIAIAHACGAQVYLFVWREDFAAAKNFALEKAQGDWIVFLDTDEWFAEGTGARLRQTLEQYEDAEVILLKMVNVDLDRQGACMDAFYTGRLFRRIPEIRYSGRIHEQIRRTDGRALRTRQAAETELLLYHSGYSSSRLRGKAERNLRVLQEEMKKSDDPARFYAYLAECYAALDEETEALRYARLDIALGRQPVTYASRSYRVAIEALKTLRAEPEVLKEMLWQAMGDFPEVPDFRAEYALFCYRQKRYAEAKAQFEQALRLQAQYRGLEPSIFYQSVDLAKQFLRRIEREWKQERQDMKLETLSACVLVKNEEKRLRQCLERLRYCVDECIVVDTGSTDQSRRIAVEAGAKVCDFAWEQDFAAARNFAITQAAGEWILFLDADEAFAESVTKEALLDAISQAQQTRYDAIVCTIVNLDVEQGGRELSRMAQARLLRREAALRFDRPVHEKLVAADGAVKFHMRRDIEILHTGVSSGQMRQKHQRNLLLLQQTIEKRGCQPWHYRYLCEAYGGLQRYEETMRYAKLHLAANLRSEEEDSAVYEILIAAMFLSRQQEAEIQTILEEALQHFPQVAEFQARYGELFWRQDAFAQAKTYFQQALETDKAMRDTRAIDFFPALRDGVYERLGELALMESMSGAADFFKQALGCNLYNKDALRYLLLLLLQEDEAAAGVWLDAAYAPSRKNWGFILQILEQTQIGALYEAYAERYAQLDSDMRERLLQYRRIVAGEVEAARQKVLETLPLQLQNYMVACFLMPPEEGMEEAPLAAPFTALLRRYRGGAALEAAAFSAYMALLPEMLRHEGSKMLRRYTEMGLDFTGEPLLQIAHKLFKGEAYALAAPFYARFAAQGGALTPLQQFEFGVAQYAAGELQAARVCLEAARDCKEKRWEIEAYLAWIEEKMSNG